MPVLPHSWPISALQAFIFEVLKVSARGEKAGAGDLRKRLSSRAGRTVRRRGCRRLLRRAGNGVDQRDPVTAGGEAVGESGGSGQAGAGDDGVFAGVRREIWYAVLRIRRARSGGAPARGG